MEGTGRVSFKVLFFSSHTQTHKQTRTHTCTHTHTHLYTHVMAVASGPAGPVLAAPVFDVLAFKTVHAQAIINQVKNYRSLSYCSQYKTLIIRGRELQSSKHFDLVLPIAFIRTFIMSNHNYSNSRLSENFASVLPYTMYLDTLKSNLDFFFLI